MRKQLRDMILRRAHGRCAYCGTILGKRWHISALLEPQIIVTTRGKLRKEEAMENMVAACPSCAQFKKYHGYEKTMTVEQFRWMLQFEFDQLLRPNSSYRKALRYGLIKETGLSKIVFFFEKQ